MSGPTLDPAADPLPHRFFLTEHIGLLVSYRTDEAAEIADRVDAMLKHLNDRLESIAQRARLRPAPQISNFPPPPDRKLLRDETLQKGEGTLAPLPGPFSIAFPVVDGLDDVDPKAADVVALVTLLNQEFKGRLFEDLRLTLNTVVLNWLGSAGPQDGIGTGGPGAKPRPYRGNLAGLNPPGFAIDRFVAPAKPGLGVKVMILDTARPSEGLNQAYADWLNSHTRTDHTLAERLLGASRSLEIINMQPADQARLSLSKLEFHREPMHDHGLFVAGIINTIAPHASLTLVEVLNSHGVGDLISIVAGLEKVAGLPLEQPMVVNCSLCMDLPFEEGHIGFKRLKAVAPGTIDARWLLEQSEAFETVCNLLYDQGRRVIAAAGNEAAKGHNAKGDALVKAGGKLPAGDFPADNNDEADKGDPRPPSARFPAALNLVLGVGALPKLGSRPGPHKAGAAKRTPSANYSNLADRPPARGVVTLGGKSGKEGIVGIYLGELDQPAFDPGWAYWSGTSFATPVVTGVIAAKLSELPAASTVTPAQDAITDLYSNPAWKPVIEESFSSFQEDLLYVRQAPVPPGP